MALRAVGNAASGSGGTIHQSYLDNSGTPGNATSNTGRGRVAFTAATSTIVVTNSLCAANSTVLCSLGGSDATLTSVRVTPAAGSFTITGNVNATATPPCDFVVIN